MPQHIFSLTRSEQRAVILIMIALLAGAAARHYHGRILRPALSPATAAPAATPLDEEPAVEESR